MDLEFTKQIVRLSTSADEAAAERLIQSVADEERAHPAYLLALSMLGLRRYDYTQAAWAARDAMAAAGAAGDREAQTWALRALDDAMGDERHYDEALSAYEEVLHRFGEAAELHSREHAARALVNKAYCLARKDRLDEALAVYDEVLRRFSEATELPLREEVGRALGCKGYHLLRMDCPNEALATWDELLQRFGEATELPLRRAVAIALVNEGAALWQMDRPEDESAAYGEVLRRFGEATD